MAECQLNAGPFISMATRCNVAMSNGVARRDRCYHDNSSSSGGEDDDDDCRNADDVMDLDIGGGAVTNNGQWVRLSKNLLLQLVERICLLSFQQVETHGVGSVAQSSSVTHQRRHSFGATPSAEHDSSTRSTRSAPVACASPEAPGHADQPTASKLAVDEARRADEKAPVSVAADQTGAGTKSQNSAATVGQSSAKPKRRRPLHAATQNVSDVVVWNKDGRTSETADTSAAKENAVEPSPSPSPTRRDSRKTQAPSERALSFTTRRHRLNAANALRRQRQRGRRRSHQLGGQSNRSTEEDDENADNDDDQGLTGDAIPLRRRTPTIAPGGRQRQSWLALNKSLVFCALERELNTCDDAKRSASDSGNNNNNNSNKRKKLKSGTPSTSTSSSTSSNRVAKAIWNPATMTTHDEPGSTHASASSSSAIVQPEMALPMTGCHLFPVGLWPLWITTSTPPGAAGLLTPCPPPSVVGLGASCLPANSSMLCALLGFDPPPSTSAPADVVLTSSVSREYSSSVERRASEPQPGVNSLQFSAETTSQNQPEMASSPARSGLPKTAASAPYLDFQTANGGPPAPARNAMLRNGSSYKSKHDKWIVLNKCDVSSLVDSLVNSMIVSSASSDRRAQRELFARAPGGTTDQQGAVGSEHRKWKSNLMQRARTETQ